jgi:hypothetical protein
MRSIVTEPTVKGEMSRRLTEQLDDPYLRYCVPCAATHVHEMPFRLAALRAGLELQPGTSPPVLQRIAGVSVDGERRWVLAADADRLTAGPATTTRLLGPFDPYLQTRDRPLLVADPARAKALWPTLGRPGAVLVDGEVVGTWRPRKAGKRLKVQVELWDPVPPAAREEISAQAERLATYRQLALADVEVTG